MVILGADPEALEGVASSLDDAAASLQSIRRRLTAQTLSVRWTGRDSRDHVDYWNNTIVPLLVMSATSMTGFAESLRRQIDQQLTASAASSFAVSTGPSTGVSAEISMGPSSGASAGTAAGVSARGPDPLVYIDAPGLDPLRQFLTYDTRGDGRAIEVFGDLMTAQRIGIWVPGVGTTIADFDEPALLGAWRVGEGVDDLAMIEWLGYDPPDRIPYAALEMGSRARGAGVELNSFVDWLRESIPGGDTRTIVLGGHSYGATVAASAAAMGTGADMLVLAGAPGVPVRSVDEVILNGEPGTTESVFVVTNRLDPIRAGNRLDDVIDAGLHSMIGMFMGTPMAMIPGFVVSHPGGHTLWSEMHTDPNTASFGATRLPSGSPINGPADVIRGLRDAHRYTEEDSHSLESIRRIYAGRAMSSVVGVRP